MSEVIDPMLRGKLALGEVWDAGTPQRVYRGRINSSREWTAINNPTLTTGRVGTAYTFPNGANARLEIARDNALWLPAKLTFSVWVRVVYNAWTAGRQWLTLIDVSGNQMHQLRIPMPGDLFGNPHYSVQYRYQDGASARVLNSSANLVTSGTWTHIVVQHDLTVGTSNLARLWVNGVSYDSTLTGLQQTMGLSSNVVINRANDSSPVQTEVQVEQLMLFPGQILSSEDVLQIYNGGQGRAFGVHRVIPVEFSNSMIG